MHHTPNNAIEQSAAELLIKNLGAVCHAAWHTSLPNLNKIQQSAAELLMVVRQIFQCRFFCGAKIEMLVSQS